ncbi:glycoside hydrolase family 31 protein [Paenibacillus sp. GYB004]|uniref:TIM-barrel domain-containing protein n=1 Tax=Paenibacillus sp. GYB004 TaxID=2994393 RepID=UPI002F96E487
MDWSDSSLQFELPGGNWMHVEVLAAGTFRVRLNDSTSFAEPPLIRYGILREPGSGGRYAIRRLNDSVELDTGKAVLAVDLRDGNLLLRDAVGTELTHTAEPPRFRPEGGFQLRFVLAAEESLYGLGDVTRERLQKRGTTSDMRVTNISAYAPIPFVMSSRGWALLMNTTRRHTFDLGAAKNDELLVEGPQGELDCYLFAGSGFGELLDSYTEIAGKPTLLPIWAYGLTFISHDTLNAREVVDDALRFRLEGIPCDMIGLAGGWMERSYDHSTVKAWHPERFYTPKSALTGPHTFIGTLRSHGFKLSLLLYCDYDLSAHEEFELREGGRVDGEAPEPWYAHLRPFVDQGTASFKLIGSRQLQNHPNRQWANGMSDEEMHNLYPVLLAKQMFTGYLEQTGRRPMMYTLAGYTGIQQYAATWAGQSRNDKEALVSMLNHGMSGHVHTTCDMFIHTKEGIHFGFLQPWSQINSWAYFRHPAFLEEGVRKLFKTYARLRYRLLPYIYSAAHVAARTGMPILRAMPLHFPDDPACSDLLHQYMLGPSLLVGAYTDCVYLPAGRWFDYWTGEAHEGPKRIDCQLPDDAGGPLFVRGGAILPMWPDIDNIGQTPVERIALHIYPNGGSEFAMYEDDGVTFGYKEGEVAVTVMYCEETAESVKVRIEPRAGLYAGLPAKRDYELIVHVRDKPTRLSLNGVRLPMQPKRSKPDAGRSWKFDRLRGTLRLLIEDWEVAEAELCVEALIPSAAPAAAVRRAITPTARKAVSAAEFEKRLEAAWKAGRHAEALDALRQWWASRTKLAASAEVEWRMHLLEGCLLLARQASQNGWLAVEVFGEDYAAMFNLQSIATKEQGMALLETLAGHLVRYMHRSSESVVHPLIQEVIHILERELDRQLSLNEVAERLHVHPSHLSRLFKREIGHPFSEYVWKLKMERGKTFLENGLKVYEAAAKTGFKDVSYFSRVFRKYWGVPPVELRR